MVSESAKQYLLSIRVSPSAAFGTLSAEVDLQVQKKIKMFPKGYLHGVLQSCIG